MEQYFKDIYFEWSKYHMLQYIGKWRKFISVNDLCVMFPDINFSNDDNDYSGDPAKES